MDFNFEWKPRENQKDYNLADDVNSLASGIIETQEAVSNMEASLKPVAYSGNYSDLNEKLQFESVDGGDFISNDYVTTVNVNKDGDGNVIGLTLIDSRLKFATPEGLKKVQEQIPTKTSQLENDSGFVVGYKTYGVSIDLDNSDPESAVTYTDDAVGMVAGSPDWYNTRIFKNIKPCVLKEGKVNYYLDKSDFSKKEDGTNADITSGNDGDVMIEIPKLGVKITTSDNTLTVQVTDNPNAEGFSYKAHTREKEGDRDKLYVSAFLGYEMSSKLRSLSGKQPTVNKTISEFRALAQANGDGYDQLMFYPLTLFQCLFLIKYKSRNSQTALGRGYVTSNSSAIQTGSTVAKGMDFGETTGKQQMKFLGIEDFWGNLFYWIDGLVSSSSSHALTATQNFNDDGTGYDDQGQLNETGGYMKTPQGTNNLGFIVKTANGSSTTYFADFAIFYGGCVPFFGGHWADGLYAGAFSLYVDGDASDADDYYGGRLMYL